MRTLFILTTLLVFFSRSSAQQMMFHTSSAQAQATPPGLSKYLLPSYDYNDRSATRLVITGGIMVVLGGAFIGMAIVKSRNDPSYAGGLPVMVGVTSATIGLIKVTIGCIKLGGNKHHRHKQW